VADALKMMRDNEALTPIAGATDLYVALNFGTLRDTRFLDIWGLAPLKRIAMADGNVRIGALATYTCIMRSRLVKQRVPMLVRASREVGGVQIQNRGTIGGNVANASPAGDTLPVLSAADAVVVLASARDGERRVAFADFYTGYRATVRRPDELIIAIEIPPLPSAQWFRKVGTRAAQAVSKVVMAVVRSDQPRIALGSVGPTVVRARRAEAALAGGADIEQVVRALEEEITPIDDVRSTAAYRRKVAGNLLRQCWVETS
jgi:CO/xanthine dehydrogenase FAD-binding subunit